MTVDRHPDGRDSSRVSPRAGGAGGFDAQAGRGRAFRGLALVFALSLVSLAGVLLTIAALGGLGEWTGWQVIGLFAVVEAAAGLSNVYAPNVWRLPVAELETSDRTVVHLSADTILIAHWGGAARAAAGLLLAAMAGVAEGLGPPSALVLPFVLLLGGLVLALSALFARLGVAWPEIDVVQIVVRWRGREDELQPVSLTASVLQLVIAIVPIPLVKLFGPGVLYRPEMAPAPWVIVTAALATVVLVVLTGLLWRGRMAWDAPAEQRREAEEHA